MNAVKFKTNNSSHAALHIGYKEKYIEETVNTKFLGLQIDNHINWKNHIEETIPNLSGACYALRSMVHISNVYTLISIYYAYLHSVINYGIIFGGDSSNSGKIVTLQKIIIRIMAGAQPRTLCRSLFTQLETRTAPCQYMLSLMSFVFHNQEIFQTNSSIYKANTRNKHHLHRPNANLSCFQTNTFYAGIKIFNILPPSVTVLMSEKATFKAAIRKYLHTHSCYSLDELYV